ncbi:probable phosphoglycerate mutase [Sanguibacter gelidistatuariae]|uniref:Probable phosphoglycerate mutase n=1 Tax=Sanguibacter gelidistatuariae TaxID=1814289 RepID=A0A1G6WX30_9MICO|nr:histidine phosphatase family protein [Sanguibacter gelidistatuariae]SDD69747.1 probable phosphoglycerate mutase [Sanguibacter gelidistatuariae]
MATLTPQLVLLRHGETEWSRSGQHTGRTDLSLTSDGEAQAVAAGRFITRHTSLRGRPFAQIRTSPLVRAQRTAELAGFPGAQLDANLMEWDYGQVEGRTSLEVSDDVGHDWQIFRDGVRDGASPRAGAPAPPTSSTSPTSPGETLADVATRATRVIDDVAEVLDGGGDVLLVAHGHLLRVLGALWLGLNPTYGARLVLGTAATCLLGTEHDQRILDGWNLRSWGL